MDLTLAGNKTPGNKTPNTDYAVLEQPRCFCVYLSLAGVATTAIFVATIFLLLQTRVCRHKSVLVSTTKTKKKKKKKKKSPQIFRRNKHSYVATKDVFCRDKDSDSDSDSLFTKFYNKENTCLLRQKYCRDKIMVVATNILQTK